LERQNRRNLKNRNEKFVRNYDRTDWDIIYEIK
jgi:hypothetical protein